jgi:uncharacterized protein YjbJ (UPF0337 family)
MNWDTMKGNWKQFQGKVKEQWGKLTDDDLKSIEGRRDQLAGAIQKRYGIEKDEAERQVMAFEQKCAQSEQGENRTHVESHGRETREKNVAGHHGMNNPASTNMPGKEQPESSGMRHDPRREEGRSSAPSEPKFEKRQAESGERTKDKDMPGEKPAVGNQPASGQQHHSKSRQTKK